MYHGKIFRSVSNTSNGEVDGNTRFEYHQQGAIVWAEYAGGAIVKGFLIAVVQDDNSLDMRYEHINDQGQLMTGRCHSTPEQLPDGRLRLHERWQWTNDQALEGDSAPGESTWGDSTRGESIIEEL